MISHPITSKILNGFFDQCQNLIEFSTRHRWKFLAAALISATILVTSIVFRPKGEIEIHPENIVAINTAHGIGYAAQINLSTSFFWEINTKTMRFSENGKELINYPALANPDRITAMGEGSFGVAQRKALRKEFGWKKIDGELVFIPFNNYDPRIGGHKYLLNASISLNNILFKAILMICFLSIFLFFAKFIYVILLDIHIDVSIIKKMQGNNIDPKIQLSPNIALVLLLIGIFLELNNFFVYRYSFFNSSHFSEYLYFTINVFNRVYGYFAESIFVPLIGYSIGVPDIILAYKIFVLSISLFILPSILFLGYFHFKNLFVTILFGLIFFVCFPFDRYPLTGAPDPMTIIFLIMAAMTKDYRVVFFSVVGAGLCHFTLATFAIIGLCLCFISFNRSDKNGRILVTYSIYGLISAFIILQIWFTVFRYSPVSRMAQNLLYLSDPQTSQAIYVNRISELFMVPGIEFLISLGVILVYFIIFRNFIFIICLLISVLLSYVAVTFSSDGIRIFSVAITGAYVFALREFVESIFEILPMWWRNLKKRIHYV